MEQLNETRAEDRDYAGKMLAQKFVRTRFIDGVVVGVPHGGVCVASPIAERLNLPLEILSCRTVKDPSDAAKSIGSVSANDVYYHDCPVGLPQDYLYFQLVRLRNEIKYDNEFYYGRNNQLDFAGRTVILVDDILKSPDTLMAAIMTIRTQRPAKVLVAVPFVEAEAARIVQAACGELVFIKMKQRINSPSEFYNNFPDVDEWAVRDLLWHSKMELVEAG
ncbi:MAG TPA: phosphoribosyltransferase family protein [Cyclobacteriaceae bacterium]|nr:phosphoribosyltransferase family protein [Cyclobacteriaceae bacterium]